MLTGVCVLSVEVVDFGRSSTHVRGGLALVYLLFRKSDELIRTGPEKEGLEC